MANYLDGIGKDFCLHCKKQRTPEGHDGCIGTLENVQNACCGHGEVEVAYVQFNHENYKTDPNKVIIKGYKALNYIQANRKI